MDGLQQPNNEGESWQFKPGNAAPQAVFTVPQSVAAPRTGPDGGITWTASEFVAHQKNTGWYALLGGGAFVTAVFIWLITKDVVSAFVILVAALALGVFAARKPRELDYRIDASGLTIDKKHFNYGSFRSFSIMQEGAFPSIVFMPMKRFSPLTTIYYDPNDEAKIVDLLMERLPIEDREHDPLDRLMWRIRF